MTAKYGILSAGLALLCLSTSGIVYGTRAALAHIMYFNAKYGRFTNQAEYVARRCDGADRLYPFNYRFCCLAGTELYYAGQRAADPWKSEFFKRARYWCDKALDLNPHKRPARLLDVRLLGEEGELGESIRRWEEYVDWDFWEPYNHALLVELYSRAGDFDKATEALTWVRGSRYEDYAGRELRDAWEREMLPPPDTRSVEGAGDRGRP